MEKKKEEKKLTSVKKTKEQKGKEKAYKLLNSRKVRLLLLPYSYNSSCLRACNAVFRNLRLGEMALRRQLLFRKKTAYIRRLGRCGDDSNFLCRLSRFYAEGSA